MGCFNLLIAEASCPNCGHRATFEVQFKYGHTRQLTYSLGDKLKWGNDIGKPDNRRTRGDGNDIGKSGYRRVRVEAFSGLCSHCGRDGMEFDIILEDDWINALVPVGITRENESSEGYIVEQET